MYAWAVRYMIRRSIRKLNAGDIGPLLNSYANDATLVFPGDHSWGGEYEGKAEIKRFLERFVQAGLRITPLEILVAGAPWNINVCVRFTDEAHDEDGKVVYFNKGVLFAKTSWGKITFQEDYEDTQAVKTYDEYLLPREKAEV
jgi:ketosteroid isomerase-like protein